MTSSDDLQLPRDPGPVPASLRDAFAWARDAERASAPEPLPDPAALDALADSDADDDARFAVIEQLLGSPEGARTLAHVVAARTSTAGADEYFATSTDLPASAPRAFVDGTIGVRRRDALSGLKPLLLAASLMLVAGTSWYVYTLPPAGDEVRSAGDAIELEAAQMFESRAPIKLSWKPMRSDVRYSLEVLDVNDTPVFTTETNLTQAVLPASTLKPGTYRWFVRARATDRTEVRSRVESFTVR
ncbi:MAG: hypothetical protein U5K74_00470 [Gemmatimonadaceae bacterium]|nr:hypothetical protein [Gemmatimonadaceae bacterium]